MQLKVPINMLATLLAIASLVAIILIVETVKRTSTPSASFKTPSSASSRRRTRPSTIWLMGVLITAASHGACPGTYTRGI